MNEKGWIAVDLDGTLAEYSGWVNEEHIGAPIPIMLERVKLWLSEGKDVRIFTARVGGERDVPRIKGFIEAWCLEHLGQALPITNRKDYGMVELWDDRCVQVIPNTGQRADARASGDDPARREALVNLKALELACQDAWPGNPHWPALYIQKARSAIGVAELRLRAALAKQDHKGVKP